MKSEVAVVLTEGVSERWVVVGAEVPATLAADWRARKLTTTTARLCALHCHLHKGGQEGAWGADTGVARRD